jgi:hypothetical protein
MIENKSKLKPCPFCGSHEIKDCYVYMECVCCLAEGPKMNNGNNDSHADYIDRQNAIKAWNDRK